MLHELLSPFMLRRLKSDVDLEVPPKEEILVYAPLSTLQHKLYKMIVNKTILSITKQKKPELVKKNRFFMTFQFVTISVTLMQNSQLLRAEIQFNALYEN